MSNNEKITQTHLQRSAFVYVRQSTASQVSVMSRGHMPLVVAPTSVGVRAALQQLSQAKGGLQAKPHSTVRLAQMRVGGGHWLVAVVIANARSSGMSRFSNSPTI